MNNYNFSKHKFGCASLYKIMSNGRGKSNAEKIEAMRAEILANDEKVVKAMYDYDITIIEISETKNKETKAYQSKIEKRNKLKATIASLRIAKETLGKEIDELLPFKDHVELSETCKSYLKEVFIKYEFGKSKQEVKAKPLEKGIFNEQEALNMVCEQYMIFSEKNTVLYENDYLRGCPDVVDDYGLRDLKAPWDALTFRNAEITDADYWQGVAYCILTNRVECIFNKCLTSLPDEMLQNQIRLLSYKHFGDELTKKTNELIESSNYDNMPLNIKIKQFVVKYEDGLFERIKSRIEQCRIFLENEKKEWGLC